MTPEALAKAYVETIFSQPNGWGQHVHPTLGRSDYIMARLYSAVGEYAGQCLLSKAFEQART